MPVWKAIVLGIVQGLTEFLPVSSSGHILIFERILNVNTGGADMFLGIVLHAGTLFAVIAVYFKKLISLIKPPFDNLLKLIIASVPAAIVGFTLGDIIDELFFSGNFLWLAFAVTALLLALSECKIKRATCFYPLNNKRALIIGLSQALAVIPGLSRSGTTLSAATLSGVNQKDATDFSFIMSVPVIFGALLSEILKCFSGSISIGNIGLIPLLIATFSSFICGVFAIKVMIKTIKKGNYKFFCIYLIILSLLLIIFPF